MSVRSLSICLLFALAATELSAQAPDGLDAQLQHSETAHPNTALPLGAGLFRTPIHTLQGDEPHGEYGIWASGDAYKVSFHDGFEFYPVLGKSYPDHLPFRWRTSRIAVADESVADLSTSTHAHTDWRYELRFGGAIERYDVRPEGVEQSFVIEARPALRGDLVIEGRIETPLTAPVQPATHGELVFCDADGNPIVRYGQATAFDKEGRSTAVGTAYDGETVRLVVPGAWLEVAAFPVTVDPLTSAIFIEGSSGLDPEHPSIHREGESPTWNTMVAYMRPVTGGDYDVYARLMTSDLQSSVVVFADITTGWSSLLPDVAYLGGADRWVIGLWRHFAVDNRVRAYFHDRGNMSLNTGAVATNYNPVGEHASFPSVGGTAHPTAETRGILVYRMDPFFGNSDVSVIHAIELLGATRSFGSVRTIASADAEAPDVNCQMGLNDDGWVVVYQQRDDPSDDYDIFANRITPWFAINTPEIVGPNVLGDKVRPVVQGWNGRYLCAMLQDVTAEINGQHFGRNVYCQRFDWPDRFTQPVRRAYRNAASSPNQDLTHLRLGFDGRTESNWCLTYDSEVFTSAKVELRRLGHTGGVTEAQSIGPVRYHAASSWNDSTREFQIVYCSRDAWGPLYGQLLQHSSQAWNVTYGTSCGPGDIGSDTIPYPGIQDYRVILENAPPQQPGLLCFSAGAATLDLGPFGAPGCASNLLLPFSVLSMTTDAAGGSTHTFALPDAPLFTGDVYWQFLYVWPAAPTALPLGATRGMHSAVR